MRMFSMIFYYKPIKNNPRAIASPASVQTTTRYNMPVADFGICAITLENGREYVNESSSPETFLVMEGEIYCHEIVSKRGESFVILPSTQYTIRGVKNSLIYKAYVPLSV